MTIRSAGYAIIVAGILLGVLALAADYLGFGEGGVQAAQLLVLLIGVLTALLGLGLVNLPSADQAIATPRAKSLAEQITSLPPIVWLFAGFFTVFVLLFVFPTFFNADHRIHYFNRFIPDAVPIGRDMDYSQGIIRRWWVDGESLYGPVYQVYPPLYAVVFAPLLLLVYPYNYYVMTALTLASMIMPILVLPNLMRARPERSIPIFFFLTSIVSYGMLFELERGQFNVIAYTLSLFAIYLFYFHHAFRHLAYVLFSVASQLKIYPALLILLFIRNWHDWRTNLKRLAGLAVLNIALALVLGPFVLADYFRVLTAYAGSTWSRPYNHSIRSFVYELAHRETGQSPAAAATWLQGHLSLAEGLLIAYFGLCLLSVLVRWLQRGRDGINFDLLAVCTIGGMVIPSVSIDYKLPLLAPALCLALMQHPFEAAGIKKVAMILLIVLISGAYTVTLFSFIDRPGFPSNSLPLLYVVLTAITILNLMEQPIPAQPEGEEKIT